MIKEYVLSPCLEICDKILRDHCTIGIREVLDMYSQPGRYYHNQDHLIHLLEIAPKLSDEYVLCACFHDIKYDPRRNDNEEQSIEFLKFVLRRKYEVIDAYKYAIDGILATKQCPCPESVLEKLHPDVYRFVIKDQNIVSCKDFTKLLTWETGIRKEYSMFSYDEYRKGRLEFLSRFVYDNELIEPLIKYVYNYQPKVGVYIGSFNPFHTGHLNIVQQANRVFDKVVIAQGINPDKGNPEYGLNSSELRHYETCLGIENTPKFLQTVKDDNWTQNVSLIRGLRNGEDLMHEESQLQWMKLLDSDISSVFFLCDKEFSNISSSGIRGMLKVDESIAKRFIV